MVHWIDTGRGVAEITWMITNLGEPSKQLAEPAYRLAEPAYRLAQPAWCWAQPAGQLARPAWQLVLLLLVQQLVLRRSTKVVHKCSPPAPWIEWTALELPSAAALAR